MLKSVLKIVTCDSIRMKTETEDIFDEVFAIILIDFAH